MSIRDNTTSEAADSRSITKIIAGKLFDPISLSLLENRIITVSDDTGLILNVEQGTADDLAHDKNVHIVDLSAATVLPGFVDVHVHFFLHPYEETSWTDQLTKEPLVERAVRATIHAQRTLMAGYTAVRDLGTEGAGDADIALRKCISGKESICPGPRYFCATRAIVSTGSYGPKGSIHVNKEGIEGITGAEAADGPDECIKVVRRQIGAGADWIKIYADYNVRERLGDVSTSIGNRCMRTFTDDELRIMVDTAHFYGVKVAVHAENADSINVLLELGVESIEHGPCFASSAALISTNDTLLHRLAKHQEIVWVPTLSVYHDDTGPNGWEKAKLAFQTALKLGIENIACGGDTGTFSHGDNAREMKLMVQLGADWKKVLRWGTLGGWQLLRSKQWEGHEGKERLRRIAEGNEAPGVVGDNEVAFGVLDKGFVADIVATTGDLEKDFAKAVSPESISFVMKGGKIYKRDGRPVF